MKSGKGEVFGWLTTTSLGFQQGIVKMFYGLDFFVGIQTNKGFLLPLCTDLLDCCPSSRHRITTFFSALHSASPKLTEGVVASSQGVVAITLRIAQRTVIG